MAEQIIEYSAVPNIYFISCRHISKIQRVYFASNHLPKPKPTPTFSLLDLLIPTEIPQPPQGPPRADRISISETAVRRAPDKLPAGWRDA